MTEIFNDRLENKNDSELKKIFINACSSGDINFVKYLLTSKKFTPLIEQQIMNAALRKACMGGSVELIQYLTMSPEIKCHANISDKKNSYFVAACATGKLEIVKYLLTSPDFSVHANLHEGSDRGLIDATYFGHYDVVKYLLTSSDLKEHANLYAQDMAPLRASCKKFDNNLFNFLFSLTDFEKNPDTKRNLEEIFYLAIERGNNEVTRLILTKSELNNRENIANILSDAFLLAKINKHLEICKQIIFNEKFEINDEIRQNLKIEPSVEINSWLELKNINYSLHKELSCSEIKSKKAKL